MGEQTQTKSLKERAEYAANILCNNAYHVDKTPNRRRGNNVVMRHAYDEHGSYDVSHELHRLLIEEVTSDNTQSSFLNPDELWNNVYDAIADKPALTEQIEKLFAQQDRPNKPATQIWSLRIQDQYALPVTGIKRTTHGHIREFTTDTITICLRKDKFRPGEVCVINAYGTLAESQNSTSKALNLTPTQTDLRPYIQALPEYQRAKPLTQLQFDLACDNAFPEHIRISPEPKAQPRSNTDLEEWKQKPFPKDPLLRQHFIEHPTIQLKDMKSNTIVNIKDDGSITWQYAQQPEKKTKAGKNKNKITMSPEMPLDDKNAMVFFNEVDKQFAELIAKHVFENDNYLSTEKGLDIAGEWDEIQRAQRTPQQPPSQPTPTVREKVHNTIDPSVANTTAYNFLSNKYY